jgi:predicted ribosomally synthesized peptide with SipW-like signal peptide
MAMLLCFTMLLGTTFAWFTDSASTAVNKIQAGTLDVQLLDENGNSLEGQTLAWQKATGHESEEVLWEPGCTYKLQPITIKNAGNLALKYKVIISGINGSEKLNEVIDWTISGAEIGTEYHLTAGASNTLTIAGHMQESAGNEYQGLSIDGIGITVVATQDTVEYDSTRYTYDTDATYLNTDAQGNYLISNANELVFFAKAINTKIAPYSDANKTFKLTADIDLGGRRWAPIGRMINTNGVGENSTFQGNFDGDNHTISNFNVDTVDGVAGNDTNKGAGLFGAVSGTISNLKVTNATIVTAHWAGAIAGVIQGTVEKCSVDNITITCLPEWTGTEWDNGDKAGSIVGYLGSGNVTKCTAKNVSITGYRDLGGIVGCSDGTVTNNTVGENVSITYDNDPTHNYKNYTSAAQHNIGDYIGRGADVNDTGNTGTANYVRGETAGTAEELKTLLTGYVSNSGESITIDITKDFDMADNWTTYNIGNYNGVNSLTINGNGHKITNLNAPLLMGAFAGDGVITINDLTISGANISQNGENLGIGAFIMHSDASGGVAFNNCKLENSVIKCTGANVANGSAYAGGFIGYSSSGNTTFTNCSVTNCQISGQKSAGGLIGHAQTNLTVDGCTVTGNTISETLAGRTSPGAAAIVGRVSGTSIPTVKNTTVSDNTINQGAAVTSSATSVVCANATYTDGGNNTIQQLPQP